MTDLEVQPVAFDCPFVSAAVVAHLICVGCLGDVEPDLHHQYQMEIVVAFLND